MAFRMRGQSVPALWAAATYRAADGSVQTFAPEAVDFAPTRQWRSPRTAIDYPVEWRLRVGQRSFVLQALLDDQELDSRRSTGAIYWEGAVRLLEGGREQGRGYLEMTGYGEPIRVG
jgi:predicted secreted hydrolase